MEYLQHTAVKQIFKALDNHARLVGGCVRDLLLGLPAGDIDVATTLSPEQMMKAFKKYQIRFIETGLKHGTLTAIIEGKPYEITTLRTDVKTDGRHAQVTFTDSYEQDALRRDFTINALYMDINGTIYDYTNGRADLAIRYVHFIGNAEQRIKEDYLRILRYFRFWGKLGHAEIDQQAVEACGHYATHLTQISAERKRAELLKIIAEKNCDKTLHLMQDYGVLPVLLPKTDIPALTAFLTVFPDSAPLQRLSVLTQGQAISLALSKAEQKELALLGQPISFSNTQAHNRLLLAQTPQSVFTFYVYRALARQEISPEQAAELLALSRPVFPLTGRDFLEAGITEGPQMKEALTKAYHVWARLDFTDDKKLVLKNILEYNDSH